MTATESNRTGLFDALAQLPPATSMQIADVAGLDEAYVRDVLKSMVAAHVVVLHRVSATYQLRVPPTNNARQEIS